MIKNLSLRSNATQPSSDDRRRAVVRWGETLCRVVAVFTVFFIMSPALAVEPSERMGDVVMEQRARALYQQIRCVQCQNQSIDGSDAGIAKDMRTLIRKKIENGENDAEIVGYLHDRYGDFVLMKPPVKPMTFGLWFMPLGMMVIGGFVVFVYLRRQGQRFKS